MTDKQNLDAAMKKILSVSKTELQRRIDADKAAKKAASPVSGVSSKMAR
jgi:hypothetical protein